MTATAVPLGMPTVPTKPLATRRVSRQIKVGQVLVGGDAPVSVQSMTTTQTTDINATLQQIAELTATGCEIVRVAVPTQDDADALQVIARKSPIPVIADIHFQPKYVFAAIDAGCAAVRVNPATSRRSTTRSRRSLRQPRVPGVPIRIGVNAGSLDKRLLEKYGRPTAEALVESAVWECSLFEEHGFRDIKISVKHNDPVVMINAYRQLAAKCDYPLHLGVTEAGPRSRARSSPPSRSARSSRGHRRHDPRLPVGAAGRGGQGRQPDPRVARPAPPRPGDRVVPVLRPRAGRRLHPGRGGHRGAGRDDRAAARRRHGLRGQRARRGTRGGSRGGLRNGKGQIFVRGEVIKTVPEALIVETLIEEALRLAEEMGADPDGDGVASGAPTVRVTS
jgi:(E)-4-hydroxy-3-methylbut-2-enyl-diphosphate synthase